MTFQRHPVVNFSNVKCTNFSYEHTFRQFLTRKKLPKRHLYQKRTHFTLMKLTALVNFTNNLWADFWYLWFMCSFYLFMLCILIFCERILVEKLLVKCWWYWLLWSISSTFYAWIFCIKVFFGSFFFLHVTREKLPKRCSYQKFAHKLLMKLIPTVTYLSHFSLSPFIPPSPPHLPNSVGSFSFQVNFNNYYNLSCVAMNVLRMRLLHAVAFSKKLRWLTQT